MNKFSSKPIPDSGRRTATIVAALSWSCVLIHFAVFIFLILPFLNKDQTGAVGSILAGGLYGMIIFPVVSGAGILSGLVSTLMRSLFGFIALIANVIILAIVKSAM